MSSQRYGKTELVDNDPRDAKDEIEAGERFSFGRNWASFLEVVDIDRIETACRSIERALGVGTIRGKTFLDVGCGSGLFSLAALRLGASSVHSFDFDPESVGCALELRRRFAPASDRWTIESGSALDTEYLDSLGLFDVVYSWGVLHHTGNMWTALEGMPKLVGPDGYLVLAIYNQQPWSSVWRAIKRTYCSGPLGRTAILATMLPLYVAAHLQIDLFKGRNPLRRYREYRQERGMSRLHDWRDWLGGYPFEVADIEDIFRYFKSRGFALESLQSVRGGYGCNQYAFRRDDST